MENDIAMAQIKAKYEVYKAMFEQDSGHPVIQWMTLTAKAKAWKQHGATWKV